MLELILQLSQLLDDRFAFNNFIVIGGVNLAYRAMNIVNNPCLGSCEHSAIRGQVELHQPE